MLTLIAVAILLSREVHAASSCSGVQVTEDKFTHTTTATVKGNSGGVPWTAAFVNTSSSVTMDVYAPGVRSEVLPAGFKILLLMQDESVVELPSTEETQPTPYSAYGTLLTTWSVKVPIDKAMAAKLAAQPVTVIRGALPGGDKDWDMDRGGARDFARAFTCYASLLP